MDGNVFVVISLYIQHAVAFMFACFSLMRNPVTTKKHYRLYVIHKVPSVRVLDFQRVKQQVCNTLELVSVS